MSFFVMLYEREKFTGNSSTIEHNINDKVLRSVKNILLELEINEDARSITQSTHA